MEDDILKGKTVLLGVTGSIAAYKIAGPASMLVKQGAKVHALMTENATNFINPITFESLTGNKCLVDTFDRNFEFSAEHVALAKQADVVTVAPASANAVDRITHGIAGDALITTIMVYRCRKIIAPVMNTNIYENPILQNNLEICRGYGIEVISPACGYPACGDIGAGKVLGPEVLYQYTLREAGYPRDLAGKRILATVGPTREAMDPVHYITNHPIGKMGYAIAQVVAYHGVQVTLVSGPVDIAPPLFADVVAAESARQMFEAITSRSREQDIIIRAAAMADYRPALVGIKKIKKKDSDLSIALERTDDILSWLGSHHGEEQFLHGFSMETQNMLGNSRAKLKKKHIDMIVANNLKVEGAGFGTDTNLVTIITERMEGELPMISKEEVADSLLSEICG